MVQCLQRLTVVQQQEYRFQQAFNEAREFEDKAYSITHPEAGKP
jgi:hypothetical protein